jgi:DNA-binding transcriptional LysR family regulator
MPRFMQANPWVDLRVDIHRYFVDLESSGADISIRLGDGEWAGSRMHALTGDAVWAVASAEMAQALSAGRDPKEMLLLRNTERDYWVDWLAGGRSPIAGDDTPTLRFNDSATMLAAVQAGAGYCLTRASLVQDAVAAGTMVRLGEAEMHDGLRYWAICGPRAGNKKAVDLFMRWLECEFPEG